MTPQEIPESWESYPAFVDGNPAMFFLNMGLIQVAPIADAPALYLAKIQMTDPGPNGVGTTAEAEAFNPIGDAICEAAASAGYHFAGRVRCDGHWELGFYGAAGGDFPAVLDAVGPQLSALSIMVGGGDDPQWGFLLEYLAPDRERWQWILDHRVVDQLIEAGDDPSKPRPVDHTAHFPNVESLNHFVRAAEGLGFKETQRREDSTRDDGLPWTLEVQRNDTVDVDTIHDVVMGLIELVEEHNGDYDGWACPVAQ